MLEGPADDEGVRGSAWRARIGEAVLSNVLAAAIIGVIVSAASFLLRADEKTPHGLWP